jgi:hypothetical protein
MRYSIYNSLAQVVDANRLDLASNEEEVRDCLWTAGDSAQLSDTTHLVFVSMSPLTADKMFLTHCRCRPNDGRDATLSGLGPGWSGGIVFIGPNARDLNELVSMEPFNRVRAGHEVLPSSARLLNLLLAIAKLEPIYPEKWKEALLSLEGLSNLKSIFINMEAKATLSKRDLQSLLDALSNLLAHDLLAKLLAHREVIGRLREIALEIGEVLMNDRQNYPIRFVTDVKITIADYL